MEVIVILVRIRIFNCPNSSCLNILKELARVKRITLQKYTTLHAKMLMGGTRDSTEIFHHIAHCIFREIIKYRNSPILYPWRNILFCEIPGNKSLDWRNFIPRRNKFSLLRSIFRGGQLDLRVFIYIFFFQT